MASEALKSEQENERTMDVVANGSAHEEGKLAVDLLHLVKAEQSTNGLRNGDYRRYHRHCSKKLRRLRKALKFAHGRGKFQKKVLSVELVRTDPRYLELMLFKAERAWSFAMEIKEEKRRRAFIIRRFAKAAKWADELAVLTAQVAEGRTALEAEAYAAWMKANSSLMRESWNGALEKFLEARRVLQGLARAFGAEDRLYQERLEEVEPSIRFCRYSISRESGEDESMMMDIEGASSPRIGDLLAEKIDAALAVSRREKAETFGSVEWCGKTIPIRTEKVREAVLEARDSVQAMEKETDGEKKLTQYDKIFIAYNDALRTIAKQISELKASGGEGQLSQRGEVRLAELDILSQYITYSRLRQTVARNLILVDRHLASYSKPEDLVRLYETLRQNSNDILELETVLQNTETRAATEAEVARFTALRCYHLARSYQRAGQQWAEAMVLFERAQGLLSSAASACERVGDKSSPKLRECANRCVGLRAQAHAQGILDNVRIADDVHNNLQITTTGHKSVIGEQQGRFQSVVQEIAGQTVGSIVKLPPSLMPVPCKPVLIDIAFDGVRLSQGSEVLKQIAKIEAGGQSGGGEQRKGYLSTWFRG